VEAVSCARESAMTTKLANTITLLCIALSGAIYLYYTYEIASVPSADEIGPAYLPAVLGVLLLLFCAIAAFREWRAESVYIAIEHKAEIALTIILTAIYFAAWQYIGYFYLMTGAFFVTLVAAYTRKTFTLRSICFAIIYSVIFVGSMYLIFDWALEINFV
jgi:hypothetical protein